MANPYTRQSSFSDGDTINSALFNDEYDQLVSAFSTSGHTHDGSTGEGAPITKLGPTQDVVVGSSSITPKTNNTVDLGSSSLKFKDAYFSGNVNVDGVVTQSGNIILGSAASDTLTINATIQGSALVFEGATPDAHEMTLAIPDVSSDKTITFPNATDTLVGKATTDILTNKTLTSAVLNTAVLNASVLNTSVSGTAFLDEDNMASNSATKIASQQSIKAYVDAEVAAIPVGDVTSVVAGTGLTGGGTTGDVTVNVIGGTGITANANDIAIDSSVVTLTGTQALSAKTLTSPVINTGVSGTAVLDEDNMSSNSATKLATQQSIKAYVDAEVSGGSITNEAVQDITGAMVTGNTETGITVTYQDLDGTLDFVVASQTDQNFTNADHTKLDAIEAQADVTDSTNVVAALTAGTGITISSGGTIAAGALALTTVQTANSESAQLGLTTQEGDVVIRSDENKTYIHNSGSAGNMNDFTLIATPTDAVTSVAGNTGVVTNAHIAAAVEAASNSHTFNDADHSKLNAIAASANNYVHPNHSGEVTSTADGATVIANNAVTVAKLNLISTSSVPSLEAKGDGSSQDGYIQLNCSQNSHGIKLKSPPHSANASYTLTFPNNDGDANQYLKTNGSGVLDWDTVDALPSQSSNSGKFLTTNGSAASWAVLDTDANSTSKGLYEHAHTIAANYSITSGNNAMTAGPITINSGVSVTVPTGSTWVVA